MKNISQVYYTPYQSKILLEISTIIEFSDSVYSFCEEHGMEKYMKFTMFDKESKEAEYRDNPYRAVNFKADEDEDIVCPKDKKFHYKYSKPVQGNRIVRVNEKLTQFHK